MTHRRAAGLRPTALALAAVTLTAVPSPAAGQAAPPPPARDLSISRPAIRPLQTPPAEMERRLAADIDTLVRRALGLPPDRRRPVAERADALASTLLAFRPGSADAHHWRAVTAGLLAELSGRGEKVRLGRLAYERASEAVSLDDRHAGAHHVLAQVYLGVLRLDAVSRFFAARMGLGPVVDAASWKAAEQHLRRAAELAPDEASFVLELGALLTERGRPTEARPHLERVLDIPARGPLEREARRRARQLLDGLGDGESAAP